VEGDGRLNCGCWLCVFEFDSRLEFYIRKAVARDATVEIR
jgi:hypothetical protein